MRLSDLGEDGLISRLRDRFPSPRLGIGIGDDAAVLDWPSGQSVVFCADLLAENTHFIRGLHPPDSVGYRAVAANVSDIGAMGGVPIAFTVALALPPDLDARWVEGFYDGVERAARAFDTALAGGDTASAESIFVDVAMLGHIGPGRAVLRSGALPGDGIYVTGALGGSALGLDLLRRGVAEPAAAIARHLYPPTRPRVGRAVVGRAHAMIDVSDGLSTDLRRIAIASGVAITVHKDRIPRAAGAAEDHALHGGEDYELLIAAPELPAEIDGVPLTRIGEVAGRTDKPGVHIKPNAGGPATLLEPRGWKHF
jgi:thiamine-monophosphate kinase